MICVVDGIARTLATVGKKVVHWDDHGTVIKVEACSIVRCGPCPTCRRWSNRIHGRYVRRLTERPSLEQQVVLAVETRRFKCMSSSCPRRTFAEDIRVLPANLHELTM